MESANKEDIMDANTQTGGDFESVEFFEYDGDASKVSNREIYKADSLKSHGIALDVGAGEIAAEVNFVKELFPFICGFCHKHFNRIDKYFKHIYSHEENKEEYFHVCNVDDKFDMVTNTIELMIYFCGLCSQAFATMCHLHEHMIEEEKLDAYVYNKSTQTITAYVYNKSTQTITECTPTSDITKDKCRAPDKFSGDSGQRNPIKPMVVKLFKPRSFSTSKCVINERLQNLKKDFSAPGIDNEIEAGFQKPIVSTDGAGPNILDDPSIDHDVKKELVNDNRSGDLKDKRTSHSTHSPARPDINDPEIWQQIEKRQRHLRKQRLRYRRWAERRRAENPYFRRKVNNRSEVGAEVRSSLSTDPACETPEIQISFREEIVNSASKEAKCSDQSEKQHQGDDQVQCHICGQVFKKIKLYHHLEVHLETRDHKCNICGKSFKTKGHLANHMKSHRIDKNFVCDTCGKAFKTKACLVQHTITHTAVKDIPCLKCGQMFHNKTILKAHMLRHSEIKAHVCDICFKGFKRKDLLTRHKKSHTDHRPFECSYCGKMFKLRNDLNKHSKRHQ